MTFILANATAQALANAITTALDAGTAGIIEIRTGAQPTDADSAATGTLLATLTYSATSFGAAADAGPGAIITAASITADSSADATGTAGWFRILTQGGGTVIADGSCGTSGEDINFNSVAFTAGSEISITSQTITVPES